MCHVLRAIDQTSFMVVIGLATGYVEAMDLHTAARRLAELGNITRLQIVRLLVRAGDEGLAVGELQARLRVPASTLAFHLRGLVTAKLVKQHKEGRTVRCTPNFVAINETLAFVKDNCCAGVVLEEPAKRSTTRNVA
jgi:ArsR family transcriptional regulator